MHETNDRRRHKRFAVDMPVSAYPIRPDGSATRPVDAHVLDISEQGLCIRSSQPFSEGSQILLSVELGTEPTWFLGTIRHSMIDTVRREYVSGVQFMALPEKGAMAEAVERIRTDAA